jgi:hypothetical protein
MAQRPAVLVNLIFVFFGVLDVESGLKLSKRGLTSDCFFNFLQDFQAILYHKLYCLLREIIHFLSADPEEGLPAEFVETHHIIEIGTTFGTIKPQKTLAFTDEARCIKNEGLCDTLWLLRSF